MICKLIDSGKTVGELLNNDEVIVVITEGSYKGGHTTKVKYELADFMDDEPPFMEIVFVDKYDEAVYFTADMVESAISHKYESERKDRWISVEDRLPSESGKYLVCYGDGHVILENFMAGVNMFYACHSDILYWSEIPEPPKGNSYE